MARKIETMTKATTTKATKATTTKATKSTLKIELSNTVGNRRIGYFLLTVETALDLLRLNTDNRPVKWGQVAKLLATWKDTKDDSGNEGWCPDASTFILDANQILGDGQHRLIGIVLAFGTPEQIRQLMLLIASWRNSGYQIKDADKDPASLVPIKDYKLPTKREQENAPKVHIPLIVGANPRVAEVSGVDEAHRTGADQLSKDIEIGNLLAEAGLKPEELAEAVRYMYLRVLPSSKDSESYGSVRRGGNIHADRYVPICQIFRPYLEKALVIMHERGPGWSANRCPIKHSKAWASIALALQGGIDEKTCLQVYTDFVADEEGYCSGPVRALWAAKEKKLWHPEVFGYVFSHCLAKGSVPEKIDTPDAVEKMIGGRIEYEQQTANRLPGWDSTGCKEVLSDSLKKKLKARAKKRVSN